MKNWFALLAKTFSFLFCMLPQKLQYFIGDLIGWMWFDLLRIRRKLVLENIGIVFPELNDSEKITLGRKSMCNMGRGFIEYFHFPFLKDNPEYLNKFEIVGLEHLRLAQEKGRGVCLLTLHLGNGDLATAGLALNKIRIYLISKEFKIKWLNDLWFNMRRKLGTVFIPPRNSSYAILKALKNNETVAFVQDQFMGPPIGIKTNFFGKETGTALGLSIMAMRYHSPIIPIYNFRRQDGKIVIVFEKEIEFSDLIDGPLTKDEIQFEITNRCNKVLEDIILKYPEQWMWVHRRWKSGKFKSKKENQTASTSFSEAKKEVEPLS